MQRGDGGQYAGVLDALQQHVGDWCQHDWAESLAVGYVDCGADYMVDEGIAEDDPDVERKVKTAMLAGLIQQNCELCFAVQEEERRRALAELNAGKQERLL